MSEKANDLLMGLSVVPPERLDEDEDNIADYRDELAIRESSKQDIIDAVGTDEFRYTYLAQREDIQKQTLKFQRIFIEQILDKISELYDFEFPEKIVLDTIYQIQNVYLFLEFIEYDNLRFLTYVWKFLKKDLIHLDIEKYCNSNSDKIIKEIEEQLDVHPQDEIISIFLRTYYKEKMIQWFIINSKKNRVEITVENF